MSEKVTNPFVYTHKTGTGAKAHLTGGEVFYEGEVRTAVAVLSNTGDEHIYSFKEDADNPNHFKGCITSLSISPINPWENVAIDTPVLVHTGSDAVRRYFAGVSCDGFVKTFDHGTTSWSTGNHPSTTERPCHRVTLADGTQPTL